MQSVSRARAPADDAPPPSYRPELAALALVGTAGVTGAAVWAAGLAAAEPGGSVVLRFLLTLAGLCAAGAAVARRPADLYTLGLASVTAFLAAAGLPFGWDSIQLLCRVLGAVALAGMVLVALPPAGRKVAATLLVLFHFGGILSAITAPPPQPWLTGQVWTRVYRPYLQFLYLNNAYHFYSPEPGPASLLWFCLEYEREDDPTKRRFHFYETPKRPDDVSDPLAITYYRRLSLSEQISQGQQPAPNIPVDVGRRRSTAGQVIRLHPEIPEGLQYRPLADLTRRLQVPSYVRHVAGKFPPRAGEKLVSVRMYRVEHTILIPYQYVSLEMSPYDPLTYKPYFLGEFDARGRLLNEKDPMLYWLVPILKNEGPTAAGASRPLPHWKFGDLRRPDGDITDYVLVHATGKTTWDGEEVGGEPSK